MHSLDGKFKNDKDQIHPLNQRVKGGAGLADQLFTRSLW
jgi:hypothetical protein